MSPASRPQSRNPDFRGGGGTYITCEGRLLWLVREERGQAVSLSPLLRTSKWNVGRLARQLGMCPRTLNRVIERSTGLPSKAWLRQLRAVTACHLLREGWKIEALAAELGFRHYNSFSREFKTTVGISPSAFLDIIRPHLFIPPHDP